MSAANKKLHGSFDLDPWRFAYVGEVGFGPVRLYGSYQHQPAAQVWR